MTDTLTRYPFGRAVPTNFRWRGDLLPEREEWWRQYGEAMDKFRQQYWQPPPRTEGGKTEWTR